jgi:hypothetical protein
MSARKGKKEVAPDWRTMASVIKLDKHGGGFAAIELIAPAELLDVRVVEAKPVKARFEVTITFRAVNLPPKEDLPCKVEWELVVIGRKSVSIESTATLNIPLGTGKAVLDLTTAGPSIGRFLETGGLVRMRLTPDYPHVRPTVLTVKLDAILALHIGTRGTYRDPRMSELGHDKTTYLIGEVVLLTLTRSAWSCDVRLRVDTPGNNDVTVDLDTDTVESSHWQIGCSGGALQLPALTKNKKGKSTVIFRLYLEVSEDGTNFGPVHQAWLVVALPVLTAFRVHVGSGVDRLARTPEGSHSSDHLLSGPEEDMTITATGRLAGFAPGFEPPFVLELWGLGRLSSKAEAPVIIYPLLEVKIPIGDLNEQGSFRTVLDEVVDELDAFAYLGIKPFAILRAMATDPPMPVTPYLGFGSLRPFGHEDFIKKGDALGVCSAEITANIRATRWPVVGSVTMRVEKDTLTFYCSVLGSPEYWKSAQPSFAIATTANATAMLIPASYAQVQNSARGILKASLPFKGAVAIAGEVVTVTLDADHEAKVLPGGGKGGPFEIKPSIGPVSWLADPKKPNRAHFICKTTLFPKLSQALTVKLYRIIGGRPDDVELLPAVIRFEHPDKAGGRVDDDGLEFFVFGKKAVEEVEELLSKGLLRVDVALPGGAKALYMIEKLKIEPWKNTPLKITKG